MGSQNIDFLNALFIFIGKLDLSIIDPTLVDFSYSICLHKASQEIAKHLQIISNVSYIRAPFGRSKPNKIESSTALMRICMYVSLWVRECEIPQSDL